MSRDNIRAVVRGVYAIQQLRIQTGNRIVAQFKAKLGQKPGEPEEELDEESKTILEDLRAAYKLMMDGVKKAKLATFKATPLISNFTEFSLLMQYLDLEECEKTHFKNLEQMLSDHPLIRERQPHEPEHVGWLGRVSGVGPAMAGVIISEIDIHRAPYVSSLWQYAGLGVEADGRGTSKRSEHLHEITYTNKEGNEDTRKGIRFDPFLKTKLMGVLSGSFLRVKNSPYRVFYDQYKHRIENNPKWMETTKGHRHNASLRFMIKQFLADLYDNWRKLEGLPATVRYQEAKLGHTHRSAHEHAEDRKRMEGHSE